MNYYETTKVRNEQVKDWLREAEHDRLVRVALAGHAHGPRFDINALGWSGLSFLVAGLLFMAASLIHRPHISVTAAEAGSPGWMLIHIVLMAALLLALWGLAGLHIYQREKAGRVGLVGFALALCGTVLLAGSIFTEAFVLPLDRDEQPGAAGPGRDAVRRPQLHAADSGRGRQLLPGLSADWISNSAGRQAAAACGAGAEHRCAGGYLAAFAGACQPNRQRRRDRVWSGVHGFGLHAPDGAGSGGPASTGPAGLKYHNFGSCPCKPRTLGRLARQPVDPRPGHPIADLNIEEQPVGPARDGRDGARFPCPCYPQGDWEAKLRKTNLKNVTIDTHFIYN